jgi:hypothetical protein
MYLELVHVRSGDYYQLPWDEPQNISNQLAINPSDQQDVTLHALVWAVASDLVYNMLQGTFAAVAYPPRLFQDF